MDELVSAKSLINWQTTLSNTAHQREVADLQAAGLNPVLSAHTNGASIPSGAVDQISAFAAAHGFGSGSGSGFGESGDFLSGLIDSLPDSGSTKILGVPVPWSTIKYVAQTAYDSMPDSWKTAVLGYFGLDSSVPQESNSASPVSPRTVSSSVPLSAFPGDYTHVRGTLENHAYYQDWRTFKSQYGSAFDNSWQALNFWWDNHVAGRVKRASAGSYEYKK